MTKRFAKPNCQCHDCRRCRAFVARYVKRLCQTIRDNGKGFEATKVGEVQTSPTLETFNSGGHGLVNMSRRAKRINGHLTIDSTLGRGTTIRLCFPLQNVTFFQRFRQLFSNNSPK